MKSLVTKSLLNGMPAVRDIIQSIVSSEVKWNKLKQSVVCVYFLNKRFLNELNPANVLN